MFINMAFCTENTDILRLKRPKFLSILFFKKCCLLTLEMPILTNVIPILHEVFRLIKKTHNLQEGRCNGFSSGHKSDFRDERTQYNFKLNIIAHYIIIISGIHT